MSKLSSRILVGTVVVGVVGGLLIAFIVFSGGSASAKHNATLHVLAGIVQVDPAGPAGYRPGIDGEPLKAGDTVKTGSDGRAALEYFDGSVTRLDFDTTFLIRELSTLQNAARSKVIRGSQPVGSTFNRIVKLSDSQSRMEISTPTVTAAVRGTVFILIVKPDGTTILIVLDGRVALIGRQTVEVSSGHKIQVAADGTFGPIQSVTAEDLKADWATFNLCDLDHTGTNCAQPTPSPTGSASRPTPTPSPTVTTTGAGLTVQSGSSGGGGPQPTTPPPPPPVNHAPHASFTATPSSGVAPLTVQLTSTSTDPDGQSLSAQWDFGDGTPTQSGDSISHVYQNLGTYAATLTVTDPPGLTDTATQDINVIKAGGNHQPIAVDDTAFAHEGGTVHIDVLANDSDPDGDPLTFAAFDATSTQGGTVSCTAACDYTPPASFIGTDSFTYTISDPGGLTDTATVTIEVTQAVIVTMEWTAGPSDLDLHLITPTGDEVAYFSPCQPSGSSRPCPSGDWATLDHDITNGPPGQETIAITVDPGTGQFHAGGYPIFVENFSCNASFANTVASMTVTTLSGSQTITLPPTGDSSKTWNVATLTLDAAGNGSATATQTFFGTGCGAAVATQASSAQQTPSAPPEATDPPTPTATPSPTESPTTPTPSPTGSPTPTPTPSPTDQPTPTTSPSATDSPASATPAPAGLPGGASSGTAPMISVVVLGLISSSGLRRRFRSLRSKK